MPALRRLRKGIDPVRMPFAILLVLALALAGCGIGGGDDSDEASLDDAETCEDVANYFADVGQDFIDDAEDAGLAALSAGMESDVIKEYLPKFEEAQSKADELGCSEDEMRALMSDRLNDLETNGPVGEYIVEILRQQTGQ